VDWLSIEIAAGVSLWGIGWGAIAIVVGARHLRRVEV
jgi:hypothetical protein